MSTKILITEKQLLKEDTLETILMAAGFVPVIGEIADIILIIRYIIKKEYIYALLMLVALIPTVGDFIAKPIIVAFKGLKGLGGKMLLRNADDVAKFVASNPKITKKFLELEKHLPSIEAKVGALSKQMNKVPGIGATASKGLFRGLDEMKSAIKALKGVKTTTKVGAELGAKADEAFVFSKWLKDRFQNKALAQYVQRTGRNPGNWVQNWWHVVRKGRTMRRNQIRKLIGASNLLDYFGLPSFESLMDKAENDKDFAAALANNREYTNIVAQATNESDFNETERLSGGLSNAPQTEKSSGGFGLLDLMGGLGGLAFIKQMAKVVV